MKKILFAALAALGILASTALAPTANASTFPADQSSYAGGNG